MITGYIHSGVGDSDSIMLKFSMHKKKRQCKPPPSTIRSEHGKVLIILLNPENDEPVGSNHVDLPLNIMMPTFFANHAFQ